MIGDSANLASIRLHKKFGFTRVGMLPAVGFKFGRWVDSVLMQRDVDRIVFGCGNFGGIGSSPSLRGAGDSEEHALRLLDHARQVGLRRFDTANTYGGGASEKVLGKWLRSQDAEFRRVVQSLMDALR